MNHKTFFIKMNFVRFLFAIPFFIFVALLSTPLNIIIDVMELDYKFVSWARKEYYKTIGEDK